MGYDNSDIFHSLIQHKESEAVEFKKALLRQVFCYIEKCG